MGGAVRSGIKKRRPTFPGPLDIDSQSVEFGAPSASGEAREATPLEGRSRSGGAVGASVSGKGSRPATETGTAPAAAATAPAELSSAAEARGAQGLGGGGGGERKRKGAEKGTPRSEAGPSATQGTAHGAVEAGSAGGEQEGGPARAGRGGGAGEIDAIFSEARSKKAQKQEPGGGGTGDRPEVGLKSAAGTPEGAAAKGRKGGDAKKNKGAAGPSGKARRKRDDGFTIYTEEELQWNKKNSGGTKLCPFDCDCCF